MLKIPKKVVPGEMVAAETVNALIDALQAVAIQPGRGYERRITSGGTILRIRQRGDRERVQDFAPFAVREVEKVGADYQITLEPGRVRGTNPVQAAQTPAGDGWDWYVPTIGGTPMDQRDANGDLPVVTVPVDRMVYCAIKRNAQGVITETPTITVDVPDEESAHYQPPDPGDSGTEEISQLVRILEITEDVSGELVVTQWWKSDIDVVNQLWQGENVGAGGGDVFKEHAEADGVYRFRTIAGNFGTDASTNGDEIEVDFDGVNLNDTVGGSAADVYKEPTPAEIAAGGPAQFRQVTQGPSGRQQIEIVETATAVQVMGNGVNGSGTVNGDAVVTAVDGIVTALGAVTVDELPSGSSGEILYHNGTAWVTLANPGDPSPNEAWRLFHDGTAPYWDPVV